MVRASGRGHCRTVRAFDHQPADALLALSQSASLTGAYYLPSPSTVRPVRAAKAQSQPTHRTQSCKAEIMSSSVTGTVNPTNSVV